MMNYCEWKNEYGEIIVQVYNKCDLPSIQKQYIEKGFYILETICGFDNCYFFKVCEVNIDE